MHFGAVEILQCMDTHSPSSISLAIMNTGSTFLRYTSVLKVQSQTLTEYEKYIH